MAKTDHKKKRPGRLVEFTEPRKRLTIELPNTLVQEAQAAGEAEGLNLREVVGAALHL